MGLAGGRTYRHRPSILAPLADFRRPFELRETIPAVDSSWDVVFDQERGTPREPYEADTADVREQRSQEMAPRWRISRPDPRDVAETAEIHECQIGLLGFEVGDTGETSLDGEVGGARALSLGLESRIERPTDF